jgi:hypothetical protein
LRFPSNAGISAAVADPIVPAASDSESDWSMDPDEARDYADRFAYHWIIDMWEEGGGDQDVTFVKRKLEKVMRELIAYPRMAGHQHLGSKLQCNSKGERIYACEANGSVTFQLAQLSMGPDTVPMALVAYIDGTFMKRGIRIRPIYCEYHIIYDIIV